MNKQIEQALEQLLCVGPMKHIPRKIPLLARAIEKSFVIVMCNKLDRLIGMQGENQQGASALILFKKGIMAEYGVTYEDLVDASIKVEVHG